MTRRLWACYLALMMLGFAPSTATAQQPEERERYVPTGSRIPRWEERRLAGYRDSVRVLHGYARCVVGRDPEGARRLIDAMPDSAAQRDAIAALILPDDRCLRARRLEMSAALMRGAAAEALLDLQEPPVTLTPANMPLEDFAAFVARHEAADVDGFDADDRATTVGRWLARCVAHERPDVIRVILATRSMSEAEQQALNAAEPVFSTCLLEGQILDVHQLTIRSLLAEALYSRAKAPAPADGL